MSAQRDAGADDLFVDRLLAEELGGERVRDAVARVRHAGDAERARAVVAVDTAAAVDAVEAHAGRSAARPWRAAAAWLAACMLLAAGAWWWTASSRTPTAHERGTALLDDFHRVMPVEPAALRDADRRQRIAAAAIPVLRDLIVFFAEEPDGVPWSSRAPEFTVWSLVLGDSRTSASIGARANGGDEAAQVLIAAADVITAADERTRGEAIARVAGRLDVASDEASSAVHCLLTAAELSPAEADRLETAAGDEELRRRLRIGAELLGSDASRLLGKPFELEGRLHDGREFTTASLQGKVVAVFYWASWCAPCAAATAELVELERRHRDEGLAVVGVSCDQDRRQLARFLADHAEVAWPQLFDADHPGWHPLAFWSGVRAVPRTFLVDRRGVLREIHTRGELERLVTKLLAE